MSHTIAATAPLRRHQPFVRLLIALALSSIGDAAYFVVLGWFVIAQMGSEAVLGSVLSLASIPRLVFMLVGGALADRVDKRAVLITSVGLRAAMLAVFTSILLARHGSPLWLLDGLALVFGVIDAFFYPASSSILPTLVSHDLIPRATSLVQTVQQSSSVTGPLVAAGLLWLGSYPAMFGVIASVFVLSAAALWMLRRTAPASPVMDSTADAVAEAGPHPRRPSVLRDIVDGVRFAFSIRILALMMGVSLVLNALVTGPLNIGLPVLIHLHGWPGSVYGGYQAAIGVGMVLGGVMTSLLNGFRGRFLWLGGIGALMGLAMAAVGYIPVAWLGMAVMGLMGVAISFVNVPMMAYLQAIIPREMLGRTMALATLMAIGLAPVSYALTSLVLQHGVEVRVMLLVCGIVLGAVFLLLYLSRDFRQMESHPRWRATGGEGLTL